MQNKSRIKTKRWIYLAGLLDGDGSIGFGSHEHKNNYTNYDVMLSVASTHRPTVMWLRKTFGGNFYTTSDARPNRKPLHHWYVSSSAHQVSIFTGVESHMLLKREQANLILEFLSLGGRKFQNPHIRKQLVDEVAARNSYFEPIVRVPRVAATVQPTKSDYQYLAGLLDAEGCISLYENKRSFDPKVQVPNTDMRVFNYLLERFGGSVSSSKRQHRECGNWVLPSAVLEQTLLSAIPYLVTKREQAVLLLEWQRNKNKLSDDATRTIIKQFRELNLRGLSPTTNTTDTSTEVKIESELHGDMQSGQLVTVEP